MNIPISWLKDYVDLPEDLKAFTDKMSMIGHMLDKTHQIGDETVIDLELRGNRADCYSLIGIAREAHASFGGRFEIPKLRVEIPKEKYPDFDVEVESKDVHRFYSCIIRNVKTKQSPEWMKKYLKLYGIDPINILVDITNYVMIETGMPMHAFDLNKMNGKKLILRQAKKGESFVSFDGGKLNMTPEDIVFGSEKGDVLGMPGILGSKDSGIHDDTTDILLECAGYNRTTIRKSVFRHKAMTEAGLRHSHDLHPSLCSYALPRAASLIMEFANDGQAETIGSQNYYPQSNKERVVAFNPSEITRLGGVEVPVEEQKTILERLEFKVQSVQKENTAMLEVTVPLFRTDVQASEDIVEEVLRIWGYEKIPSKTLSSVIPKPLIQPEVELEELSRDILTAQGLDEIITVPFVHEPVFDAMQDPLKDRAIPIVNPPTSLHTHLRTNMFVEHLAVAHKILARGDEKFALFEIGKIYLKKDKTIHQPPHKPAFPYVEIRQLTAIFASKKGHWDYYHVKGIVENYMDAVGITNVVFSRTEAFPYSLAAEIRQGNLVLGTIGVVNPALTRSIFHLETDVIGFVLNIEELTRAQKEMKRFTPYSQYPANSMDMSVQIDTSVQAGDILETIKKMGGNLVRSVTIEDVYEKKGHRSILFRMKYQSKEKNLTTEEVNEIHKNIAKALQTSFKAVIRGNK